MPKFGFRKIGRAAFERDKLREKATSKFGPRKFGAKKAAQMKQELAEADAAVEAERGAPAEETAADPATTSVKAMAVALADNGQLLDEFINLEKARPSGTRKTAIKLFLGTEMAKAENARDEVIAELQSLL